MIPRIALTPGEPAGIGPDITIQAAQKDWAAELVVFADPDLLITRAKQLDLPLDLIPFDAEKISKHVPSTLKIIPIHLKTHCSSGEVGTHNAAYVLESLTEAVTYCSNKTLQALVTGPVHKGIMNAAGYSFSGHTEFLQDFFHVKKAVMLFVAKQLKVALATTHVPLRKVPDLITEQLLTEVIMLLHTELIQKFNISHPKILICGLNPHAGEQGYLGDEEIKIITPTLKKLRDKKINVEGPLPADTIFTEKYIKNCDAILSMYHDQALPVVKFLGFSHAVNVTLGLPIIRTSVDHGTALDLAGSKQADAGSLESALTLAIELVLKSQLSSA